MKATNDATPHRRKDDAFIARWARRIAPYLVPVLLTTAGYLWNDRRDRINRLNNAIENISSVQHRIDLLEKRLEIEMRASQNNQEAMKHSQQEIKAELAKLRDVMLQTYRQVKNGS